MEKEKLLVQRIELLLNYHTVFSSVFDGLTEEFKKDHNQYIVWLSERITDIFNKPEFITNFSEIGIDSLTLHYKTRHFREKCSSFGEWIQVGLSIPSYIPECEDNLKVYSGNKSPYIPYFYQRISKSPMPMQIFFHEDSETKLPKGWLCVKKSLINYILFMTNETSTQDDFSILEMNGCLRIAPDNVETIRNEFAKFSGDTHISTAKALGMLRTAFRVTFLALNQKHLKIKIPRIITLVPVYMDVENVIGGIAFSGNKILHELDSRILKTFAETLLSNLRVREEGLRNNEISYFMELNRGRADFIQRSLHDIRSPIDNFYPKIFKVSHSVKNILEAIKDLSKATEDIIMASKSRNVENILIRKIKSFMELNRERADFTKQTAHSIHYPIEKLYINVNEISNSVKNIHEAIKDWGKATENFAVAFRSKNVEDLLVEKISSFSISEFLDTLKFGNQKVFDAKGIEFEIQEIPEEWEVSADKTALWQVMNNLIDNARSYARQTVQITVERTDKLYIIHVFDDGPGIDPAIRDELFKPGVSLKKEDITAKSIYGFSLFLSFQVVKKHGGKLYINKDTRYGAEFIIELPRKENK